MNKKILKLISLIFIFCCVIFFKNDIFASTENYDYMKKKKTYDIKTIVASSESDITNELENYIEYAQINASETNPVLIYITSGRYYLGDVNPYGLNLPSYTTIVAENDTEIVKKSATTQCLLEVVYSENSNIYGGIWNSNNTGIQPLDLYQSHNIVIENVTIKNSPNSGINISDSNATIINMNCNNNNRNGIEIYGNSTAVIRDSEIKNNSINGINISSSNVSIYNSELSNNGGHGSDIYGNSTANIENTIFKNNNNGINIASSRVTIKNIKSNENNGYGLQMYGNSDVSLDNSEITRNKRHGIYTSESTFNADNNIVSYNNVSGITAGSGANFNLKNNKINYNGQKPEQGSDGLIGHGIGINTGAYGEVYNNEINNNNQCGISIFNNQNKNVTISNNRINNNGRHGIGARKNISLSIISNTIKSNFYNGILLSDNSKSTVKNCVVNSNSNLGISVVDNSSATLENCEFYSNTQSNVSASGKKSSITMLNENRITNSKKSNGISISGTSSLNIKGDNNVSSYNYGSGICLPDGGATVTITGRTYLESNNVSGLVVYGNAYTVKNLYSANNGQFGVSIRNKGTLTLTNSTIKGNKLYGVHVVDSGTKAKIEKNNIYKNKSAGINVDKKATVTSIYKNELNKNGNMAIRVCNSAKVSKIKNNTIKKHNKYGIYVAKKGKISKVTGNKFKSIKKKNQIYKTK